MPTLRTQQRGWCLRLFAMQLSLELNPDFFIYQMCSDLISSVEKFGSMLSDAVLLQ